MPSSTCPDGYYIDTNAQDPRLSPGGYICLPCNENCARCTGPQANDCQACNTAFVQTAGVVTECRTGCGDTSGSCQFCHSQCQGCIGPTNRDCVKCRESSISQGTVCVPSCSQNEYLDDINGEYICLPCHIQCNGCKGRFSTDCLQCQSYNNTVSGAGNCVSSCPARSYVGSQRRCLACHEQCVGCNGPSNLNCTSCVEESRVLSGGILQCVQRCPLGQMFDTEQNSCVLTR